MATTISSGGVYQVLATDTNIYVRTGFPVTIVAPQSPSPDQTFRVFLAVFNAAVMMTFSPNQLNKFGPMYQFGPGLDTIAFVWDGIAWNAY